MRRSGDRSDRTRRTAAEILADAVWRGLRHEDVDDATLRAALRRARANGVQGGLARVYPERLAAELELVELSTAQFRRNLADAASRLAAAGVEPVLIKCDPADDFVYGNFDLVVGDDGWAPALEALRGWEVGRSAHPLEPGKVIVHPAEGPAAHLHRHVSWLGVVIVTAPALRRTAARAAGGDWLLPEPDCALRLLLAHAVFQNLAVDLGELAVLRRLQGSGVDMERARQAAVSEGWGRGFDAALGVVRATAAVLDAGGTPPLPAPLPPLAALSSGLGHSVHLVRGRHPAMALREAALRGPLVVAKTRRRHRWRGAPARLIGVSGPDGSGKTTLVAALRDEAARRGLRVATLHPYGCVVCRHWPAARPRGWDPTAVAPERVAGRALRRGHVVLDAAEFAGRVGLARLWLRLGGLGAPAGDDRPPLVVTDRSPLDALVKHEPAARGWARRCFLPLARAYDRLVVLDADPEVLAGRDPGHPVADLAVMRDRFRTWLPSIDAVTSVPAVCAGSSLAAEILDDALATPAIGDGID